MSYKLLQGDCLEVLKTLKDNSVSALVTDPPAGIGFMGKDWDSDKGGSKEWINWMEQVMTECLRVLKPGAHGLVWAIPRTSHWTATALENAGFEIRDVVTHLFGTGFPKSLDISKAIDKAVGAEREVIGPNPNGVGRKGSNTGRVAGYAQGAAQGKPYEESSFLTAPATPEAKQWSGYGTALKPASEHWVLVRKPLSEKTVAANVLKWGTGGINIDASRIGSAEASPSRFPANLILDERAAVMLNSSQGSDGAEGPSRFFYVAKASPAEKNAGLEDAEETMVDDRRNTPIDNPFLRGKTPRKNTHPTVKSIKLMEYLVTLITPPGRIVLDPFMGSGSTGLACLNKGFQFLGIEKETEYLEIAKARLKACQERLEQEKQLQTGTNIATAS